MSGPRWTPCGLITLTTDFGTEDGYVGAMKGVMLSLAPDLRLHDLAHAIPPQDLVRGAEALRAACPCFPAGTVHLVVVDPGVGGARRPVVAVAGAHAFVAPDNGILAPTLDAIAAPGDGPVAAWDIARHPFARPTRSATFHGRDLFAPAAAALAAGLASPCALGPPVALSPSPAPLPQPAIEDEPAGATLAASVAWADRFGNCVTNLPAATLAAFTGGAHATVRLPGGRSIPIVRTYADVAPGEAAALVGSGGRLEIAVRDGSARETLGLSRGDRVALLRG